MKLIANGLNKQFFSSFLPPPDTEIDGVVAAIAYGDDKTSLLDHCIKNHHRLDIWMRYDHTVPVSPAFLSKLLANVKNNIFCKQKTIHMELTTLNFHVLYATTHHSNYL